MNLLTINRLLSSLLENYSLISSIKAIQLSATVFVEIIDFFSEKKVFSEFSLTSSLAT